MRFFSSVLRNGFKFTKSFPKKCQKFVGCSFLCSIFAFLDPNQYPLAQLNKLFMTTILNVIKVRVVGI
jgi:hypothetical protein